MAPKTGHRIVSTTTVLPLGADRPGRDRTRRIELTPYDLQLLYVDYIQKGLLFPKPKDFGRFIEQLEQTLAEALAIFYPLAGRLAAAEHHDETVSFYVECDPAGAAFIHAVADGVTAAEVLEPVLVPDDLVYSFFPMNGAINADGVSKPLLAVQVTELVDGVFIGMTINHTVMDGTSFWKFFNAWSRICRERESFSSSSLPFPVVVDHNYLKGVVELPIRIPASLTKISGDSNHVDGSLRQRMFHFSKEKISELKAQANAEMGTTNISSLQALMGNLWVSITRNRALSADEEVSYCVIIGLRSRMDPPLADDYLGNAVALPTVKATAGELIRRGVGWAAWEINKTIARWTSEEVKSLLREWAKSPVFKKKEGFPRNFLLTGSSPRFDVFGNDFGWGKPAAVRSGPGNKFDGKLTVFPGAEQGSVDFEACLSAQTLEAMAHDQLFLRTLATPTE